jgi:hypothetical protein
MIQKMSASPELVEGLWETYRSVENAYQDEKMKPLKVMSLDIDDQVINHMPLTMAIEFKNLMKEKFQINYNTVDKDRIKAIKKILKKEKISNHEEYELIMNRIDEIFSDTTKAKELKSLNELLVNYEKSK